MLGRTAASIRNLPAPDEAGYEAAVRQVAAGEGMTSGEVEAYMHMAQRAGQEQERTMTGILDAQAKAISDAASDVALRLLRQEIRESGLSGLGQFDIGALISTAISAASSVASAKIQQQTQTTVAKQQASIQASQERMAAQQAKLAAAYSAAESSSGSLTSAISQPTVWVPVALAGGALVLFLMLRK